MNTEVETKSITLAWDLAHPPAKVWRALTEPALLARWLMSTDMQPEPGRAFTFRQDPTPWWDGVVHCEVLAVELHRRIRYSWRSGTGASQLDTVVTWTLEPTAAGGTHLAMEQTGFLPRNAFALDGATKGWERMVREALTALLADTE